jgi:hypothetical protein
MKHADIRLISSIVALTLGCAAAPGTQPHDASAAQHEAMAAREERAAEAHAEQHDPKASTPIEECAGWGGCWTSSRNPTAQHAEDAKKHRELAQKHRAAAAALAGAEASSCAGISDSDRDISPFYHREDIVSVSKLTEEVHSGKSVTKKEVGSTVVFRAVPGMTAEWFQRVVDCHVARATAVGHDMPEMSYCPLALKGVKAGRVTSTGSGFAVSISSDDPATVAEIQKRASALKQ